MRFPGLTEPWQKTTFKEICKITTGSKNTQDKVDNGLYPFYVRSQTIERINEYTFDGEAILTAGDGVGVGKVFHYSTGKIGVHQRVYLLTDFKCDGKYLFHYFSSKFYNRVKRMSAKNSVDSVRMEMIAEMPISLPSIKEQQIIGTLLSKLDERIATQRRLIDKLETLIKGIVVYHFNSCNTKRTIAIKDLGEAYSVGNLSKEDLTEYGEQCIIYGELFTTYGCVAREIQSRTSKYNQATLSRAGDLLFPASTTVDAISLIAPTSLQADGVYVAGDMFGIHISPQFNSEYISYLLNYVYYNKLSKYAQGSTIIHLHYADIKNTTIQIPCLEEQNKCAELFEALQTKHDVAKQLIYNYQLQKSYLLRQMFK